MVDHLVANPYMRYSPAWSESAYSRPIWGWNAIPIGRMNIIPNRTVRVAIE